jgi:hypothetical protein
METTLHKDVLDVGFLVQSTKRTVASIQTSRAIGNAQQAKASFSFPGANGVGRVES